MKQKLANRSDRRTRSSRSPAGRGPTIRRGYSAKELRAHQSGALKAQHASAMTEAAKRGFDLVPEKVARLIRAAGGPQLAPVAGMGQWPVTVEHADEMLTGMPPLIVERVQRPPPQYEGLALETRVLLAVEEWKAQGEKP